MARISTQACLASTLAAVAEISQGDFEPLIFSNCSGSKRPDHAKTLQGVIIFSLVIESQRGWEGTAPPAPAQGQQHQAARGFAQSGLENL